MSMICCGDLERLLGLSQLFSNAPRYFSHKFKMHNACVKPATLRVTRILGCCRAVEGEVRLNKRFSGGGAPSAEPFV
jgi:hypothetical protein